MKALCWHGKGDMRHETVPDPKIAHPQDAIIKVTACAICGSDLHIYNGVIPEMEKGDIIGHETMGEVVEVGSANKKLKLGDRIVVPFTIACGECFFCQRGYHFGCERTNPDADKAIKYWGHSPAGLFGYSHILGGYAGGQGRISACAVCRRRPHQGAGQSQRRAGIVPLRHLSYRLHGGRVLQHPSWRYDRDMGMRPGRTVRHS
jgi:threonine dehydrogenase-like Zn-dependent dehydrogenase